MTDDGVSSIAAVRAGAAGGAAWLLGYAVTYLAGVDDVRQDLSAQAVSLVADEAGEWKMIGWAFYNAHGVDVRVPPVAVFPASSHNYVAGDATARPLYLLPPLVLVVAGFVAARWDGTTDRRWSDGATVGAAVAVGYLTFTVAGLLALTAPLGQGVIRPEPVGGVALAGLAYPLAFGALGGIAAHAVAERDG